MPRLNILDDQPANIANDQLHFGRYLSALQRRILERKSDDISPLVVGIFSPWGSGKSTLLGMLEESLKYKRDPQVGCLENYLRARNLPWSPWVVVKFSPWMYRNEKTLLLPLLAAVSKEHSSFSKIARSFAKSCPDLIDGLSRSLVDKSSIGLLISFFFSNLVSRFKKPKDLQEQIAKAVSVVTQNDRRLVFLIDDLDRCNNPKQIVNLLEQIKLFLHLDRCLFFIAADRKHIVDAINIEFPNSGEEYLEKFVQVSFNLPPNHSQHLIDVLDVEEKDKKAYRSLCEVLGNNPRKLKQLWNEAVLAMEVLNEEMRRPNVIAHKPDMELMLKWLLLKYCGELRTNPYRYLDFEKGGILNNQRDEFIQILDFKNKDGKLRTKYQRRAVYLWNDRNAKSFGKPNILSLYAHACGENNDYARSLIEEGCFEGDTQTLFDGRNFEDADLSDGHFHDAVFLNCDFERADFRHADLSNTKFINCELAEARFDSATILDTIWENCHGMDSLDTEPILYEQIADSAAAYWRSLEATAQNKWDCTAKEGLFKAYRTILEWHINKSILTDAIKDRINEKGRAIRTVVET